MRILWIDVGCAADGNNSGDGIAWLRQRIEHLPIGQQNNELIEQVWHRSDFSASLTQRQRLLERIDSGVERIVIASVNRLDYPSGLIELLQHICPEVPLALACDSWWDGWRRTGLRSREHLSLPWYRWWDGWVDWLQGRTPQLYEPAPAEWCLLADAPRARSLAARPPVRGLIVGNCRQTLAAWSLAAAAAGYAADCISEQVYQQRVQSLLTPTTEPRATFTPQWIMWDDSCLDTAPIATVCSPSQGRAGVCSPNALRITSNAQAEDRKLDVFFEQLPILRPTELPADCSERMLGIVAISLPRGDWAQRLCSASGRELLVKPNSGQGLTRLLDHYFSA